MTKLSRRTFLAGVSTFSVLPARADTAWPARPVTLMHGFPAGGPVDTLSRILADGLSPRLGQPVVVEPKPGATGTTVGGNVARAAADGYTLLAVPATYVATAAMFRKLPYKPIDDFTFISTTAEYPMVLVTHPDSVFKSIADLISISRARSTPLQYGTAGVGSLQHLSMEFLAKKANITLQHIPYQGGMPAITDLLGKRIDFVIDPPTALVQFVKDEKLRALAVTGSTRFFGLPEVPTVIESGFPGYVVTAYQGIAGPAGLSGNIVTKINIAVAEALADPTLAEKLKKIGNGARPSSPDEFKARIAADIAQWKRVVEDAHLELI